MIAKLPLTLSLFVAHAKNGTVQIVQLCMNVDTVKMISVVHVVLPLSAQDLNVMTRIIISASAVDAIAIDVRDCIAQIAAVNINAMYVILLAVASVPRIMNARIVTLDTVTTAPR